MVLALGGDAAGREAVARLGPSLLARGLTCAAVELPEGTDPNALLVSRGPQGLLEALAARSLPVEPDPEPEAEAETSVESTGDGFVMELGEVRYRVSPCPPFGERLQVVLKATRGERTFTDTPDLFSHRAGPPRPPS